jgi:hypothetical protein
MCGSSDSNAFKKYLPACIQHPTSVMTRCDLKVPDIRPDSPSPGKGKLAVEHLHAGIIGADTFELSTSFFIN